jgi:hypothetical protein
MNRIFSNNRIIVIAFFTVFSIATGSSAMANDSSRVLPVELKYIGSVNNQPLVQLTFAGNAEENEFTIIIRDEDGNSLYKETIKGENFYKKFLLNNDEIGNETLQFEVISKRSSKSVVFEVNREFRYVNEMAVNKMK